MNNEEVYSDKETLKKLFDELKRRDPDILSVILTNREGLEIASDVESGEDALLLSAMIASLYAMGEKTVTQMNRGPFSKLIVSGENASVLILGDSKSDLVIGLTLREQSNLGLALIEAKRAMARVTKLLKD
ncbi:MAG: roadblock/LC7 domain-containing protein [Candidatus Asgardarchaeia archaeon]